MVKKTFKEVDFDNEPAIVEQDIIAEGSDYNSLKEELAEINSLDIADNYKEHLLNLKVETFIKVEQNISHAKVVYSEELIGCIDSFFKLRKNIIQLEGLFPTDIKASNITFYYQRVLELYHFYKLNIKELESHTELDVDENLNECFDDLNFLSSYDTDDYEEHFPTKMIDSIATILSTHSFILLNDKLREKIYGIMYFNEEELKKIKLEIKIKDDFIKINNINEVIS